MTPTFFLWTPATAPGQSRARLVVISRGGKKGTLLVGLTSAYREVVAPGWNISLRTLETRVREVCTHSSPFHEASALELRVLREHGGAGSQRMSRARVVTVKLLHRALIRLEVLPHAAPLHAAFRALFQGGTGALEPLPAMQLAPVQANDMDQMRHGPAAIPLELPTLTLRRSEVTQQCYGLGAVAPTLVEGRLREELQALREYLQKDGVLQRPKGVRLKSTNEATWSHVKAAALGFLGFGHSYGGLTLPSLSDFRDNFRLYLAFISFLNERRVEGASFYRHCLTGTAPYCLYWL
jgi:hypothetical protein